VLDALRAAATATLVCDEEGGEKRSEAEKRKAAVEGVLAVEVAWAAWARYRAVVEASVVSTGVDDAANAATALDAAISALGGAVTAVDSP
jgi:hypothetical protein